MAFIYLHLHRISNSIFSSGNLSTLSFTEFKKHQGHVFSILNFRFFKLSVVAASPSRYPAFTFSYLLLQTPAARAAPADLHPCIPVQEMLGAGKCSWASHPQPFSNALLQGISHQVFSLPRNGIPTRPHPFLVRVMAQAPQCDCRATPPATLL